MPEARRHHSALYFRCPKHDGTTARSTSGAEGRWHHSALYFWCPKHDGTIALSTSGARGTTAPQCTLWVITRNYTAVSSSDAIPTLLGCFTSHCKVTMNLGTQQKRRVMCKLHFLTRANLSFEICSLLGNYAAYSGDSLPTFRDNLTEDGTDRFSRRKSELTRKSSLLFPDQNKKYSSKRTAKHYLNLAREGGANWETAEVTAIRIFRICIVHLVQLT